ncbi:E3 ubiquitin-protein ligase RNF139-like [Diadema setosum]|uniref:E3 ubiquitin-protein ligase RNF139-like n=1 Tax=Diadema setosum TaxID=31175 RepID=UPI003B3A6FE1
MSRNLVGLEAKYGPIIRVPPLLLMDAIIAGGIALELGDTDAFPVLSTLLYLAVLLLCAVLFFLPSSTLCLCYGLVVAMAALRTSQWWNAIFLQRLGMANLTDTQSNSTAVPTGFGAEGQLKALAVVCSDEFLFYICIQMMYSFVFAKTPALFNLSQWSNTDAPIFSVWMCLVSPVFLRLFLSAVTVLPARMMSDAVKTCYFLYPIIPILMLNILGRVMSFVYHYLINLRIIARTYLNIFKRFGFPVMVENQWVRLKIPTVLRLFWLTRLGIQVSRLVFAYTYAHDGDTEQSFRKFLSLAVYEIAVESCSTFLAVMGLSATISPAANVVGQLARLFLGVEREGGENIGTVASVLFFILALQTGLPDMSPENRVVRLGRNMCLLSTAILHFVHTMLHGVMMQLSTMHVINRKKHARALTMACFLILFSAWFIVQLWYANPIGTWMLALTAFCLELIIKIVVSLILYILFVIDTHRETFWEGLDDYVYYVKATGSVLEFVSGIFLFINGAWIFIFESRGVIRAIMICTHAYFNIFQLGKDGWKKFRNRRLAVQKIKLLEQASPALLEKHNDVCAICYQELNSACITPCGHLFHALCLRKWLYMQDSCPLCHKEILFGSDSDDRTNEEHSEEGQNEEQGRPGIQEE